MATLPREHVDAKNFVHEAMPYRDEREYLDGISTFVRAALAADRPVLVEVPDPRGEMVREALGADAAAVRFGNMTQDGRNPGRIIPAVLLRFADAHPGRRVAIVGEPLWPMRSAHAYAAAVQHEALINLAFTGRDASILCPYNLTELPERALTDAERTHPTIMVDGRRADSPNYTDPRAVVEDIYQQQLAPPADAETFDFTIVAEARQVAYDWATRAGLPADRVTDLLIAISEIGGNSVVHGGDGATLLRWTEDDWLVCEIRDRGHITDPLAGRLPAPVMTESGRGLLMVNYLCDLVQLKTGPAGTAIRLWMRLSSE
jgi:anti-sigma regulatory factor (Ser/Thr protein kinase)